MPIIDYKNLPPDLKTMYWHAFTPDTTPNQALIAYRARYGAEPMHIVRGPGNLLLLGPVRREA